MNHRISNFSRREVLTVLAVSAALPCFTAQAKETSMTTENGLHDFDFLAGSWTVAHRKLKKRLAGCTDWAEFTGTSTGQPIMGGVGNMDDNVMDDPTGRYRAVSLRHFDAATGTWSIWWFDERYPGFGTPITGRFENGVGTFLEETEFEGRPIVCRYLWSEITPTSARWQQAFSPDGGETWETNWDMHFERRS